MRTLWRALLAGALGSLAALVAVWWWPLATTVLPRAEAQGVGIFSRANCSTITAAVAGQTFCFDQTANALKVYNGTAWILPPGALVINVMDGPYYAKCDGATDDSVALAAALAAVPSTGGAVFFPGTCAFTTTLVPKDETTFIGLGRYASGLKFTSATVGAAAVRATGGGGTGDRLTIRDMFIKVNGNSQIGLDVVGAQEITVFDAVFNTAVNGSGTGLLARASGGTGSHSGTIIATHFEGLGTGAQLGQAADTTVSDVWNFYAVKFSSNGTALLVQKSTNVNLTDGRVENQTVRGVDSSIGAGVVCTNVQIRGTYFEANTGDHIRIQAGCSDWSIDHITGVGGTYSDTGDRTVWRGLNQGVPGVPFGLRTAGAVIANLNSTGNYIGASLAVTGLGTFGGPLQVYGDTGGSAAIASISNTNANGNGLVVVGGSSANDVQILQLKDAGGNLVAQVRSGATGAVFGLNGLVSGAPTGGAKGTGSINANTYYANNNQYVNASGTLINASVVFANLNLVLTANGMQVYCSDCTAAGALDQTCVGGGTGNLAVRVNGVNKCVH